MSSKILVVLGFFVAISAQAGQPNRSETLDPFSSTTVVPNDATNVSVDSVKYTKVATLRTYDWSACEPSFEPGSSLCPQVVDSNYVSAIEVHYTYESASTEVGQDDPSPFNEDSFFIDPTKVGATELSKIPSKGALKGKAAQAVAAVTTHDAGEPVQVVDWAASKICDTVIDGDYVTQVDPDCVDQYAYKTVTKTFRFATVELK